jgi:16S rRNA (guanine966-N2)-methyltransferase
VEKNRKGASMLAQQADQLAAQDYNIVCDDALNYLGATKEKFDIVFLDPPFSEDLLQKTCETLLNKGHLRSGARIYVESANEVNFNKPLRILKQAKAGKVYYMLLESGI